MLGERIDRVVPMSESDELAAMAALLYTISIDNAVHADAIVTFPGLGEWWRFEEPILWWVGGVTNARYLLLAGINTREQTSDVFDPSKLEQYGLADLDGVVTQGHAEHTREQAEWLAQKVRELDLQSIALFAPAYHLLRAYLTVLKTFLKEGILIPIFPVPNSVSPFTGIPEFDGSATGLDMLPGEFKRIHAYQEKGDVADFGEFREYLRWFWSYKELFTAINSIKD